MNDYTSDVVIHILCKDTLDARVSEDEVVLLNSLPTEEIIPILQRVFYQEHDDVVKSRAFDAIVSIQAFDKVQFLLNLLNLSSPGWRAAYCEELSRFHDARAIAQFCEILEDDPDPDLRYVAAESLAKVGDSAATKVLKYAQKHDKGKDYEGFRVADMASQALQQIRKRLDT